MIMDHNEIYIDLLYTNPNACECAMETRKM